MDHNEIVASQPAWLQRFLKTLETFRFHQGDSSSTFAVTKIAMVSDSVEVLLFYDPNTLALQSALADASVKNEPPAHLSLFAQPGTPYVFEEVAQLLLEAGFDYSCARCGGSDFEVRFVRGQKEQRGGPNNGSRIGVYASLIWHR